MYKRINIRLYPTKKQEKILDNHFNAYRFAYNLCLENAKSNNYSLRDWNSFKTTILSLIENGSGKFIAAYTR